MMTPERCSGFHILPPRSFFPVNWYDWEDLFEEIPIAELNWDKEVIAVHLWNAKTADTSFIKTSNQIGVQIVRSSCPRIFSIAPEKF